MSFTNGINTLLRMIDSSRNIKGTASGMLAASTETAIRNNKFEALSWNLLLLTAGIGTLCYVFKRVIRTEGEAESHERV